VRPSEASEQCKLQIPRLSFVITSSWDWVILYIQPMKKVLTLVCALALLSCQDKYKDRQEVASVTKTAEFKKEVAPVKPVVVQKAIPTRNHRFAFIILKVKEPILVYQYPNFNDILSKEIAFTEWEDGSYASKIVEYDDFTEDEKYKLIDDAVKQMPQQPTDFIFDVYQKVTNSETKRELLATHTIIKDKVVKDFATYKEASIAKSKYGH